MNMKFLSIIVLTVFLFKIPLKAQWSKISTEGVYLNDDKIVHDGKAYFLWGNADFYTYDGNTFTKVETPSAYWKHDQILAAAGNKIFFAGGYKDGNATSLVSIYNTTTGGWNTASLSQARMNGIGVSINGKVLFAGGWTGLSYTSRVDIHDVVSGRWSTASLTEAVDDLAAVTVGTRAFFIGGQGNSGISASLFDIYDASTNEWTRKTLPVRIMYPQAAVVGDLIFIKGQAESDSQRDRIDIYNTTTDKWDIMRLPSGRSYTTCTAVGNKVIFAGGEYNGGSATYRVDIYDVVTKKWSIDKLTGVIEGTYPLKKSLVMGSKALFFVENDQPFPGNTPFIEIYDASAQSVIMGPESVYPNEDFVLSVPSSYAGSVVRWEYSTDRYRWTVSNNTGVMQGVGGVDRVHYFRVVLNGPSGTYYSSIHTVNMKAAPSITGPTVVSPATFFVLSMPSSYAGSVIQWEYSPDRNFWYVSENTTTSQGIPGLQRTHYFRVKLQGPSGTYYSNILSVDVVGVAVINGPTSVAPGQSFVLSLPSAYGASVIRWEYSTDLNNWTNSENPTITQGFPGIYQTYHFRVRLNGGSTGTYYSLIHTVNATGLHALEQAGKSLAGPGTGNAISLSPNPTSGHSVKLTLFDKETPVNLDEVSVTVFSMMGEVQYSKTLLCKDGCTETMLDVQGLKAGLYHVTVRIGEKVYSKRLIVE